MRILRITAAAAGASVLSAPLGGCAVAKLIGVIAQNAEYQKQIEVYASYPGLENRKVAVVVDVDQATRYEHAGVDLKIATYVTREIQRNVPGVTIVSPLLVQDWQFRTPQWRALPYGELAGQLDADRVVHIDLREYRLHPYGNQWIWEGVCAANVGIIEREAIDPDNFVESFQIQSTFPREMGVDRSSASETAVELGLLKLFVQQTGWLFYKHLEPKYPDKFQPPPPES